MAAMARRLTVRADQSKRQSVLESGGTGKRMLLSVARRAVLSVRSLVNVLVAARAVLTEAQKTLLPHGQSRRLGVGMTFFASHLQVLARQVKIESGMVEPARIGNACQSEAAGAGDLEIGPMMIGMALGASGCLLARQLAVEPPGFVDLLANILVAIQARLGH